MPVSPFSPELLRGIKRSAKWLQYAEACQRAHSLQPSPRHKETNLGSEVEKGLDQPKSGTQRLERGGGKKFAESFGPDGSPRGLTRNTTEARSVANSIGGR